MHLDMFKQCVILRELFKIGHENELLIDYGIPFPKQGLKKMYIYFSKVKDHKHALRSLCQ